MTIYFKDGSNLSGYTTFKNKQIELREKPKGKKKKYKFNLLDSAVTFINPRLKRKRKPKTKYFLPTKANDNSYAVFDAIEKVM